MNEALALLNWSRQNFGLPGVVSVASVCAVGYMLKVFVAALRDVSAGNSAGLQQISEILRGQERVHEQLIINQVQHTEVLRSLVGEVKALGDNIHRSEIERGRQMVDLVGRLIQKGGGGG